MIIKKEAILNEIEENKVHANDDGYDLLCSLEKVHNFNGNEELRKLCEAVLTKKS